MSTYIKEIILENFLSHSYSRIQLTKGINLITGPNGSGKSAILLGISVALGQSYTERSRKLSDLIKYGKDVARVTLILDNTPKKGKRPFSSINLDQVMITRIIRSDGMYWFELNQELVEKHYLQRQLKKLGINPDNMLIIMHQNMIEDFATRNPMERLLLFEEAIGISEYRKLVMNALNRLEEIEKGSQSLMQSLANAEVNLKYWKNLYSKYEKKIKLIELISKLKNELFWANYNEMSKRFKELKEDIENKEAEKRNLKIDLNNLEAKINYTKNLLKDLLYLRKDIDEILNKIDEYAEYKANYAVNSFKISLLDDYIKSKLKELRNVEEEINKLEKKKREYVKTSRSVEEIESEIRDLQAELKTLEEITDEIPSRYKEYLQIYEDIKQKSEQVKQNKEKAVLELKERMEAYQRILKEAVANVNKIFQNILSKVEGSGYVEVVNIENLQSCYLDISVGFRGTSPIMLNSFSQSGGERVVATMAFLLACQQYMRSAIRAVDEFDIHMDLLNKERISVLLSSLPKENPDVQYIFITPDPMLEFFKDCNIIIVTKQQGISKIGKLS